MDPKQKQNLKYNVSNSDYRWVQLLVNFISTVIIYTTNLYRLHDSHFEFLVKLSYYLILE